MSVKLSIMYMPGDQSQEGILKTLSAYREVIAIDIITVKGVSMGFGTADIADEAGAERAIANLKGVYKNLLYS